MKDKNSSNSDIPIKDNSENKKTEIVKFKKNNKNEKEIKVVQAKDVGKNGSPGNLLLDSILNEDHKAKSGAWESGIKILETVKVFIPLKLLLTCNQIAERLNGEEFSLLTNLTEQDNVIRLSQEFHIPQQVVSSTSIDYIPEDYNFNCVIHRHPDGLNSFSSTDRAFINQNFKLSILYTRKEGFVGGIYNLKHGDYLVQIPIEVNVDMGIDLIDISNIKTVRGSIMNSSNGLDSINRISRRKQRGSGDGNARSFGEIESDERSNRFIDIEDDNTFRQYLNRKNDHREHTKQSSMFDLDKEDKEKMNKLLDEEKMDYNLLKRILLEDVNDDLTDINNRLSEMEGMMYYGHPGM